MKKYLSCVWEDCEIEKLKNAIRKNGRDWEVISSTQVVTKSAKQCRQFYFYFKYNLNLDELMKMTTFQTDDFDSDTCWKEIASDNESSEDEYLIERKILDPNLEKLQDCKKLSSSQLSLKSDCDSSATMSADEGTTGQNNLIELDSRITPPSRSNSAIPSHLASSFNDRKRPASSDNLDIDLKIKSTNNQKHLQPKPRFPITMNKPPVQMPSFVKYLINPNAPTVPSNNNQNKLTLNRQDSPTISTPVNNTPTAVSLPPTPLAQQSQQQQLSQQISQASKEKDKATCVRDLIYHTIDITFQTDKGSSKSQLDQQQQQQNKDIKPSAINPTSLPIYFPPDTSKLVPTTNPALQHIISPFNLNLSPLVSGIPLNSVTTSHLNEIENEVQDLSKKSTTKKEPDNDYLQPKNYSLSKSKNNEYVNLTSYNTVAGSMPPPAHLSRTSTPGLETDQQQQLQNFYLNNLSNLNSLHNAARHTESPRSRGLTPNHHLSANPSSQSPTPNSNRSSSSSIKSNQSKMNIAAPPPLIANNLINSQQYSLNNNVTTSSVTSKHQGSITQGTPVHLNQQQQHYLLNKEREAAVGSITLGTPLYRGNSHPNMPKLTSTTTASFMSQNPTSFNLSSTLASGYPPNTILTQNLSKESHLSSTQNQIMIDFNTSKQMQKRSANLSDSNKERNSPLSINRLTGQFQPTIQGYSTLPLGFNPALFATSDAQKAALELTKSQSQLIDSNKAISPKISPSPNSRQNLIYSTVPNTQNYLVQQQQTTSQNKNLASVIQTSSSSMQQQLSNSAKTASNMLPLYTQSSDFQTNLLTLVNTAAAQKSLAIPSEGNKKCTMNEEQLKEEDKNNFFNQSALKFSRNPFTKEQFDKEMKNQELIKLQKQQQQLIDEQQAAFKNERNKLTKYDLDPGEFHASRIFSDSFQKDTSTTSSQMLTAASLIDAIICHQINQPDLSKSSQKDKFSTNPIPTYTTAGNNFLNDRIKTYINEMTNTNQASLTTQSINPLHLLHDRNLSSNLIPQTTTASSSGKPPDDLLNENWKLRKALEPKDSLAARSKENNSSGSNKIESHIELETISPPSTPTKEQQQFSNNLNIPTSLSNIQLASAANDPIGFQKYFQNRIVQAMNKNEQIDKESEIPRKKTKLDDELMAGEDMKKDTNKLVGLESISSLSELKAQKAEFQKQQLN